MYRIVFIAILAFPGLTAYCQPENWIWRTYDQSDGLTSSHVTAFAEDHHGFIWMGTDIGLNRFDGTHFSTFQANESDSTALINGRIMTICPDDKDNILVGTYAGISLFDYHSGRFKSWKFNFDGLDPLEQNFIRGFVNWKDGHTWVATLACVVDWDREKNTFQVLDSTYNVSRYGAGNPLIPDEDGWGCWMATSSGMKHYNRRNGMLTNIDPGNGEGRETSKERYLEAYTKDKEGRIWYSVLSEGKIYCYDPKTGIHLKYNHQYKSPSGENLSYSTTVIMNDSHGRFWFSSWSAVIGTIDFNDSSYHFISIDNQDPLKIPFPMTDAIFESRDGDIWIGTNLGASVHSRSMEVVHPITIPETFHQKEHSNIHNRCLQKGILPNDFFVGTSEGLFWYHWQERNFTSHPTGEWGLPNNEVMSLLWVGNELWCGTRKGLWSFNPTNRSLIKMDIMDAEFSTTGIYSMIQLDDEIWFSCRNSSLYSYNISKKSFKKYTPQSIGVNNYPSTFYQFLRKDPYGKLWMAGDAGVVVVNPLEEKFQLLSFYDGPITHGKTNISGFVHSGEYMWLTTSAVGVFKINCQTLEITEVPGRNKTGKRTDWALCSDSTGNVWFGSSIGISTYNNSTNKYQDFRLEQALSPGELHNSGIVLSNGMIVLSSSFAMLLIDPFAKKELDFLISPIISQITSTDTSALFLSGDIKLTSERNHFTFYFSSPSAAGYSNVEYQYRVDEIDENWVDAGNKTFATYGNLSGGRYTVRVRARSADGEWNEISSPLIVEIDKKYFETLWFKLSLAFSLILLLAWLISRRKKMEWTQDRQLALKRIVEQEGITDAREICVKLSSISVDNLRFSWIHVYFFDEDEKCILAGTAQAGDFKTPVIYPPKFIHDTGYEDLDQHIKEINLQNPEVEDLEVIPLIHEKQLLGWIFVGEHKKNKSYEKDLDTLKDVASISAGKLAVARSEMQVKKKEELLTSINALLSESQLVSLRAQMNPHFVFNCLNSIQESIVMKHYAEASLYLNKFSRLFRMVLQNSSKSLINLDDEINVLTLYLELEHMRFQRGFEYSIECDEDLDISEIKVPSMLIQPFVENALWHGLMHKSSDRKLNIRFYPKDSEVFICEVLDNGIGRKKAAEIKAQKTPTPTHESKGISISTDRLRLISLQQDKQASVIIKDLEDTKGNAIGTSVVFELSLYLN